MRLSTSIESRSTASANSRTSAASLSTNAAFVIGSSPEPCNSLRVNRTLCEIPTIAIPGSLRTGRPHGSLSGHPGETTRSAGTTLWVISTRPPLQGHVLARRRQQDLPLQTPTPDIPRQVSRRSYLSGGRRGGHLRCTFPATSSPRTAPTDEPSSREQLDASEVRVGRSRPSVKAMSTRASGRGCDGTHGNRSSLAVVSVWTAIE